MGKMKSYNSVDEYFDDQTEKALTKLLEIRKCIFEAAPQAEEKMNYGIPCYALVKGGKRDTQVMMAAYHKHVSFYPMPSAIEAFKEELAPHITGKGTIQFGLNEELPKELIKKMVIFRMDELGVKG